MILAKVLEKLDRRIETAKNWDGGDFYEENFSELDFMFPIDDAVGFFRYIQRYMEIIDDDMKNPPEKLTTIMHQFIQKYKSKF